MAAVAAKPVVSTIAPGKGGAEVGLAIAVVLVIGLLIIPLPGVMLDMLLVTSISLSLVVLLSALYTTNPLEFSSFPGLLLLLTLFRLALNVASTRLNETRAGDVEREPEQREQQEQAREGAELERVGSIERGEKDDER